MKKKGPCCHCGTTETPLWRNGPPGKPVLCNACGSRWRTKGTLANYTPKHCSLSSPTDSDDDKEYEMFMSSYKKKPRRLKIINRAAVGETVPGGHQYTANFENNISNSSSSGAGTSLSGNCIQPGNTNGNSISGSAQRRLWGLQIPSRKRTSNKHRSPTVEKLGRDLCLMLKEQESSSPSESLEELLIYNRQEDLMGHIETALGGLLLKRPLPSAEKKSEASVLMAESKASCSSDTSIGDRSLVSNLGAFKNTISSQSPMYQQPLNDESFSVKKVTASSSTHVTEAGTSQPTNGPIWQPHYQASEARRKSSGRLIVRIPNSRKKAFCGVRDPSKTSDLKGQSNLSQQKEF